MKIVTLTLSPAFDIHADTDTLAVNRENIAKITDYNAGGKGVNISRALLAYGVESTAIVVLPEENGESFAESLRRKNINFCSIITKGRIRENITVHTSDGGETRLSFEGAAAPADIMNKISVITDELCDADTVLTLTGRIPAGVSLVAVKEYVKKLSERGVRVVIDSKSFSLADLIEARPFLIKPNEEEISLYTKTNADTFDGAIIAAKELCEKGIENVMISLGEKGAVLVSGGNAYVVPAPSVHAVSTIGAGDSSIAGFLAAMRRGASLGDSLKLAVAFGSAACLTEGTRPPRKEDITEIFKSLNLN